MRWASILAGLGHRVTVAERYGGEPFDLLVALHARRSAPSIRAFRAARPGAPIVVALWRAETDAAFLDELRERCARLAPLFDPRREMDSWRDLLAELIR